MTERELIVDLSERSIRLAFASRDEEVQRILMILGIELLSFAFSPQADRAPRPPAFCPTNFVAG